MLHSATIPVRSRRLSGSIVFHQLVEEPTIPRHCVAIANSAQDPVRAPELIANGNDAVVRDGASDVVRVLERVFDAEQVAVLDLFACTLFCHGFDPAFFLFGYETSF